MYCYWDLSLDFAATASLHLQLVNQKTNVQRPTGDRSALPPPLHGIFDWLAKN